MQLGNLAAKMRSEGVAVGPRPGAVDTGIRIRCRGLGQLRDYRFGIGSAQFTNDLRRCPEPFGVGWAHVGDRYRRMAAVQVPADHLVTRVALRTRRLGRKPGMNGERAAPTERPA
jgi:hypothetical protein